MGRRVILGIVGGGLLAAALGVSLLDLAGGSATAQTSTAWNGDRCDVRVSVAAGRLSSPPCIRPGSGEGFRDCPDCPEMVVAPPGSFMMGSSGEEPDPFTGQAPLHKVTIAKPFAIGKFAVTFAEWQACAADGGCGGHQPSNEGWVGEDRPVINVSWSDARSYADWLSHKTGQRYRLLSEAEFEYAARAGSKGLFWWGNSISPSQANYDGKYSYAGSPKGPYRRQTMPVKSFEPNPWGLYQVHGNVATWTEDCWVDTYNDAPLDGSARTTGNCKFRVTRGGSWYDYPQSLRVAVRLIVEPRLRTNHVGFRVARELCQPELHSQNAHENRETPVAGRC